MVKAGGGKGDWVEVMGRRLVQGRGRASWLQEVELGRLCDTVRPILAAQPMLVEPRAPINIVGDIHGQFLDLLRLFDHCGYPGPNKSYLFLGDYVDRGRLGTETIALLFCYKVLYPDRVFLLRGNHESAAITKIYGFYDEMEMRFSLDLWKRFMGTFDWLPVAGLVEGRILAMHGGLSPHLDSLNAIRALRRPQDVPDSGLMCDLLWSDPNKLVANGWAENTRGIGFTFAADVVRQFCRTHGLDLIVRAHQVVESGYEFFAGRRLLTIFSAPNYCGEFQNAAAVLTVSADLECSFVILSPNTARFPVLAPSPTPAPMLEIVRDPIVLGGRYVKLTRLLPHSPGYFRDSDEEVGETTVEQALCKSLKDLTKADAFRFTSAGREDKDTRMLGTGRPFAVKVFNPRRICLSSDDLRQARYRINDDGAKYGIGISSELVVVTREQFDTLKDGETEKTKAYSALCFARTSERPEAETLALAESMAPLSIQQRTPVRVLTSRSNQTRTKRIHSLNVTIVHGPEQVDKDGLLWLRADMETEAGTYIKEFINSDFGRTTPSLGSLLGLPDLDCHELDVTRVNLLWPPQASSDNQGSVIVDQVQKKPVPFTEKSAKIVDFCD